MFHNKMTSEHGKFWKEIRKKKKEHFVCVYYLCIKSNVILYMTMDVCLHLKNKKQTYFIYSIHEIWCTFLTIHFSLAFYLIYSCEEEALIYSHFMILHSFRFFFIVVAKQNLNDIAYIRLGSVINWFHWQNYFKVLFELR